MPEKEDRNFLQVGTRQHTEITNVINISCEDELHNPICLLKKINALWTMGEFNSILITAHKNLIKLPL